MKHLKVDVLFGLVGLLAVVADDDFLDGLAVGRPLHAVFRLTEPSFYDFYRVACHALRRVVRVPAAQAVPMLRWVAL